MPKRQQPTGGRRGKSSNGRSSARPKRSRATSLTNNNNIDVQAPTSGFPTRSCSQFHTR